MSSEPARDALAGLKVLDFCWVVAGPMATRYLAVHGAAVVRIESRHRPDVMRGANPYRDGVPHPERSGYYAWHNTDKYNFSLNMRHSRAREVVHRLVRWADVVTENFTPGTMEEWALGFDDLRKIKQEIISQNRAKRLERVKALELNRAKLAEFLKKYEKFTRQSLIQDGYLFATAPEKGTDLIAESFRTEKGNQLLMNAKDILFVLLFGDASTQTQFERKEQELLTLTLPRFKAEALDFMKATTELSALGTWQDPDSVSNDQRADNIIFEVEYGEVDGELIGNGVVRCLSLINNLEVNEQVLYARMMNIEKSTLIE